MISGRILDDRGLPVADALVGAAGADDTNIVRTNERGLFSLSIISHDPVRILVRKSTHELWLLLGEVPVRAWPVGLGLGGRTPEGEFEIGTLQPKPDYWPPQGKRIPFGQKGNPLGTRWMGFRDTPEAQGFGIHGTDEPDTIGKDLSQG